MGRRSTTSPYGSNDILVDNRIGSAFPIVCAVEKRLPEIIYLARQFGTLQQWYSEVIKVGELVIPLAEQVANDAAIAAQGAEYVEITLPTIIENADKAQAAREESELIAERINATTTIDFLNFEINEDGDLLAHFAGYADESNFSINEQGQLEVKL